MSPAVETLSQKQRRFSRMVGQLISHVYDLGLELTFGEAYRTPEQAKLNSETGKGISHSLHCDRLALDLNLWRDGEYQAASEGYAPLGEYWESIGGAWGGRFRDAAGKPKPDGNHFSLAHDGRK